MRFTPGLLSVAAASALFVSIALTGCSTPPPTGSVTVSNDTSTTAQAAPVHVTITDENGAVVGDKALKSGESYSFSDIPLGPVTVTAEGLCTVATTLTTAHTKATAHFSPTRCMI